MFVIGVIIVVIGLILLKNIFSLYSTVETKRFEEANVFRYTIDNVDSELKGIVGLSKFNDSSDELQNFSIMLRNDEYIKLGYVYAYFNMTSFNLTIYVGNYLDNLMNNLIVNVTNSTPTGYSYGNLNDETVVKYNFKPDINGTLNITVSYMSGKNYEYKFYVLTSTEKNYAAGFFDTIVYDNSRTFRKLGIYNMSWSP